MHNVDLWTMPSEGLGLALVQFLKGRTEVLWRRVVEISDRHLNKMCLACVWS